MNIQHYSMFKRADTETGYVQCTIKPIYRKEFIKLGFVDNVNDLPERKRKKSKQKDD
jgi:hypothetical protein